MTVIDATTTVQIFEHDQNVALPPTFYGVNDLAECFPDGGEELDHAIAELTAKGRVMMGGGSAPLFELVALPRWLVIFNATFATPELRFASAKQAERDGIPLAEEPARSFRLLEAGLNCLCEADRVAA